MNWLCTLSVRAGWQKLNDCEQSSFEDELISKGVFLTLEVWKVSVSITNWTYNQSSHTRNEWTYLTEAFKYKSIQQSQKFKPFFEIVAVWNV